MCSRKTRRISTLRCHRRKPMHCSPCVYLTPTLAAIRQAMVAQHHPQMMASLHGASMPEIWTRTRCHCRVPHGSLCLLTSIPLRRGCSTACHSKWSFQAPLAASSPQMPQQHLQARPHTCPSRRPSIRRLLHSPRLLRRTLWTTGGMATRMNAQVTLKTTSACQLYCPRATSACLHTPFQSVVRRIDTPRTHPHQCPFPHHPLQHPACFLLHPPTPRPSALRLPPPSSSRPLSSSTPQAASRNASTTAARWTKCSQASEAVRVRSARTRRRTGSGASCGGMSSSTSGSCAWIRCVLACGSRTRTSTGSPTSAGRRCSRARRGLAGVGRCSNGRIRSGGT